MRFIVDRDSSDHYRFSPIQTTFATDICNEYEMPIDVSTAVSVDEKGAHRESTAVLRIFPYLSFPYNVLGSVAMLIPKAIRDPAYMLFARNRGAIWKFVRSITGLGETTSHENHAHRGETHNSQLTSHMEHGGL